MVVEVENVVSFLKGTNGTLFAVFVAVLVVLFTIAIAWCISKSRNRRNTVLLVGLSDAGKTLLFSQLYHGKFLSTHTSIKENKGRYKPANQEEDGKFVELIDVPGNEKLRGKFIAQYKDQTRGLVFVVDSVNFTRELHAVAECLFDILSNKTFNRLSAQILIACNKQDLTTAKSMNVIKSQLAKEINTLRKTRAAAVKGLDEQLMNHNDIFVGRKGKDFDFTDLHGIKVDFVECSAKGNSENKTDLKDIQTWLRQLI